MIFSKNNLSLTTKTLSSLVAKMLTFTLSVMLCILSFILAVFLVIETSALINILVFNPLDKNSYKLIEGIITWFLYFEFIALIAKYFSSDYHFPLRYFIYIGITAIIRLIIVDHDQPMGVLLYSFAILVLLAALYVANTQLLKRI